MPRYEAVIGLETHVRLATKSKLFCSCSTKFGEEPNKNTCEVCSGSPGALPSPNREAIRLAALVGVATNCEINAVSRFARKNYFYPDLPNGYQISQFEAPICERGYLELETAEGTKRVGITRIHMENDAGKNIHSHAENLSFVDLNRAGTPLIEIVSEPDMRSGEEAAAYLKKLHSIVTYLGASDGNMEEGSFRCDANVSLRPVGSTALGTRAELKNLNSFRNVQRAIEYEIERQTEILSEGGRIKQETRLFDAERNLTEAMRSKEEAEDYRYFPDPDLLPIELSREELAEIRMSLPPLPDEAREKIMRVAGLARAEAEQLVQSRAMAEFFEKAAEKNPKKVASILLGPIARDRNAKNAPFNPETWLITPEHVAKMAEMVLNGVVSDKIIADIIPALFESGEDPEIYVKREGLTQITDEGALAGIVDEVIARNPEEAAAYRGGKKKLLSFFVGQIMRATKGKANPGAVNRLLREKLN